MLYAGDATRAGTRDETRDFVLWMNKLDIENKCVIFGNHDVWANANIPTIKRWLDKRTILLDDEADEICGMTIWGSSRVTRVKAQSAGRPAGVSNRELFRHIPASTSILLTHQPPKGILDVSSAGESLGCEDLRNRVNQLPNLRLHVFGHIHGSHGSEVVNGVQYLNVAYLNPRQHAVTVYDLA